jgi:hypothetical protein
VDHIIKKIHFVWLMRKQPPITGNSPLLIISKVTLSLMTLGLRG